MDGQGHGVVVGQGHGMVTSSHGSSAGLAQITLRSKSQ